MRVTIEHTTKKVSVFKSAPAIALTVEFSELERAVINKSGLAKYAYYTAPIHSHVTERLQGPSLVDYLLNGKTNYLYFEDAATARAEEAKVRDGLKSLKAAIEANAEPIKANDTFEL